MELIPRSMGYEGSLRYGHFLPLPGGEGRGEGERSLRCQFGNGTARSRCDFEWPADFDRRVTFDHVCETRLADGRFHPGSPPQGSLRRDRSARTRRRDKSMRQGGIRIGQFQPNGRKKVAHPIYRWVSHSKRPKPRTGAKDNTTVNDAVSPCPLRMGNRPFSFVPWGDLFSMWIRYPPINRLGYRLSPCGAGRLPVRVGMSNEQ